MFLPVGKLIVALVWAFWMMSVDSSLGREHNDTEEQIKKIIKVTDDDENPEYFPTCGSTFDRIMENGTLNCGTKLDLLDFLKEVLMRKQDLSGMVLM